MDELRLFESPWWQEYLLALAEQQAAEIALVDCAARRAAALAHMKAQGWSLIQLGEAAQITPSRVWQLLVRDRSNRA